MKIMHQYEILKCECLNTVESKFTMAIKCTFHMSNLESYNSAFSHILYAYVRYCINFLPEFRLTSPSQYSVKHFHLLKCLNVSLTVSSYISACM